MVIKPHKKEGENIEGTLKFLETAYHISEKKYRELIDLIPLGIFEFDLKGIIAFLNPMGFEMLGYTQEDIDNGLSIFSFAPKMELTKVKKMMNALMMGETIEGQEYTALRKTGNSFPVMLYLYPIKEDNKVIGVRGVAFDLSKSKKIEEQLQELLTRYEIMVKAMPDLIFRFDSEGRFIDYHSGLTDELMLPPEEFIGKKITEINFPQNIADRGLEMIKKALRTGEIILDEYQLAYPHGICYYEARYIPIGKNEVLDIIRDITPVKTAHDTIRKIEIEKAVVLDSMSEMFAYFSPDMKLKWVNKSYADNLGINQLEIDGQKCCEIWHDRKIPCNACPVALAAQTGKPHEGEVQTPDGKYWHIRGYPVYDDSGTLVGLSEFCEDITDRKKALEELKLTQFSVDQNPDAAFWMEKDARLFYVNETACKSLGYSKEELLKLKVHDIDILFPVEIWEKHWEDMKENKVMTIESIHKTKEGEEFPVELMINYLEFDGKEYNCAFARNISSRKVDETKLRRAKEKAEEANRVKSDFISNISHEIRTPLNSIIGFSEMLTSHLADTRLKEYASSIRTAGNSLLMLINDILDLSKIEADRLEINPEPVNMRTIIMEVSQIFSVKVARKDLEFIVDVNEKVPELLLMDKIRIRQVLFNLIGNAVKFTDSGYIKLIVDVPNAVTTENGKVGLVICVEDSGVGIEEEYQEEIFSPFVQITRTNQKSLEGTGLGLSITKRLVEMMGGSIQLKSKAGKGASFTVIMDNVGIADNPSYNFDRWESSKTAFKSKQILLVDDSDINRRFVKDNLVESGMEVVEASHGAQGFEKAKKILPDLILLDIMMPVMDGYELMEKLKNDPELAGIPVIALTALAMKEDIDRISSSGFDGFLIKPFHIEELFEKMEGLLESRASILSLKSKEIKKPVQKNDKAYAQAISDALVKIDRDHLPLWKLANELKEFKSIRIFAEGIHETGKDSGIKLLVDYGDKLLMHCDNYDIEKIDRSLAAFPDYVKKMKEIAKNAM